MEKAYRTVRTSLRTIYWSSRRKRREKGRNIFKEIMHMNILNLGKD